MIQKYCAYHTIVLLVISLCMHIFIHEEYIIAIHDFESTIGKLSFGMFIFYSIVPVLIHTFSMLVHMFNKSKWLWFLVTILIGITAPLYYFIVYKHMNTHNKSLNQDAVNGAR